MIDFFTEIAYSELSGEYVGKAIRTMAEKWGLKDKAKPKRKSNTDFISQTWAKLQARSESKGNDDDDDEGKPKEKHDLLNKLRGYQQSRMAADE